MPLPIHVDAYSGWRTNERPRAFVLDERYVIIAVEDDWYSPDAKFFKERALDGKLYILRHDEREDEWTPGIHVRRRGTVRPAKHPTGHRHLLCMPCPLPRRTVPVWVLPPQVHLRRLGRTENPG